VGWDPRHFYFRGRAQFARKRLRWSRISKLGMLESKSPVERIAPALEKIVSASLRRAPVGQAPLLAWPLACGSAVAARTTALSFDKGVLRVEVPDAGWRAELRHLAPQYLAVINRYSSSPVGRIEFVIRPAKSCA